MVYCPFCENVITSKAEKAWKYRNVQYKLFSCHNCGLKFWHPAKIIPEFYERECSLYFEFHQGKERILDEKYKLFFKNIPLKKGKLLDIGCGDGFFLFEAQKIGFEVYGVDIDKKSIAVAKNKYGLKNVYPFFLKDFVQIASQKNLKFDIITAFDVLEHQDDPKSFLEDIKFLLKPGGYFIGTVPNSERFLANLERKYLFGDWPPHHFLWISKRSLFYFLKERNFTQIHIQPVRISLFKFCNETSALFTKCFRNFVIKSVIKKTKEMDEKEIGILKIEDLAGKKFELLFSFLKIIRNLILFPFVLCLYFFIPSRYKFSHIYFEAKL